jgi:hypothetical protein
LSTNTIISQIRLKTKRNVSFDVPELAGKIEVRVEFKEVSVGTEVHITQSGLPDVIPVDGCYLGWQESLQLLAFLVNPDIPDE